MKLLKLLNDEKITEEELKNFKYRRVSRAIAFDTEGKIALVHAKIKNYYVLPGGGVRENETLEQGAIREAKEEAGCDVKIIDEVGIVKEYIKSKELINEQFCYVAKVIGEKSNLNLDEYEMEEGMEVVWVDINEAINLLKTNEQESQDIVFLEEIKNKY